MPVGRLSLGTAQLGMPYGIAGGGTTLTAGEVTGILQTAIDLGLSALDTAPDYGLAEQRVGEFIAGHELEGEIRVTTKLPSLGAIDAARVAHTVEERLTGSLRRLRCDYVDVYLLHDVADLARHGERLVDALARQRDRGRVLEIGVSLYDPEELERVEEFPDLTVVQHPFNLLDRRLLGGDWLQRLRVRGMRLQIRSVLLQGLLGMSPDQLPESMAAARHALMTLRELLAQRGLTLPEAAIAFAASLDTDRVIIGAHSSAELEQSIEAFDSTLPDDLHAALDAALGAVPREVRDPRTWLPTG